ncbi:hypothetical protein PISL3812_06194 [Talaromyces islandicus]|uniref:Methyltransferase domain-containing protein n=1 Tax=Talaromyces islandicus TaxID=28573 RepID=A0A0U1M0Q6_TALIS|nr:hypothetical protein PISL3812_06194 [Talaromyces islandicus]
MERLGDGTRYDLGRDFLGSARLNLQHYLWKETLGYDLHPNANADNASQPLHIADVGTGTGIFLLSLARRLPKSYSFVGFDISDDQFPIPASIPENVSFRVADAMREPPVELWGKFDIVHLRLFFCVVDKNDPLSAFNFCLKLLKPGGFLQWDEYDQADTIPFKVLPKAPITAMTEMRQGFNNGRQLSWITTLKDFCINHGLQNVECIRTRPPRELLKPYTQMVFILYLEHATLHDAAGNQNKGDSLRKLIDQCAEELKEGGFIQYEADGPPLRPSFGYGIGPQTLHTTKVLNPELGQRLEEHCLTGSVWMRWWHGGEEDRLIAEVEVPMGRLYGRLGREELMELLDDSLPNRLNKRDIQYGKRLIEVNKIDGPDHLLVLLFDDGSRDIVHAVWAADGVNSLCRRLVQRELYRPVVYTGMRAYRGKVDARKVAELVGKSFANETYCFIGVEGWHRGMAHADISHRERQLHQHSSFLLGTGGKEIHAR